MGDQKKQNQGALMEVRREATGSVLCFCTVQMLRLQREELKVLYSTSINAHSSVQHQEVMEKLTKQQ